jgi:membrane protease YdiL (CAAX protease family)
MRFAIAYLTIYAAALALLVWREDFGIAEPLLILVLMGGGFSLLAWLLTRRAAELPVETGPLAPLLPYLLAVAAFVTWGLGALPMAQPWHDAAAMISKLAVFVAIPALLFRTKLTWRRPDLVPLLVMAAILTLFQAAFGSGFAKIASSGLTPVQIALWSVLAFVWLAIEAGLVEEYFFRAVLQTRIERALRSRTGGIVVAALLFGLIHAPGLYLRGNLTGEDFARPPSLLFAIGYAVVILSPTGLFFGVLWTRTRNLPLIVALHGLTDLVPNLVPFAKTWQ